MTERDRNQPDDTDAAARQLEESLSSGRITAAEADTIRSFFASKPAVNWPSSTLQHRMQSSGG
jgi:hypothetical protein